MARNYFRLSTGNFLEDWTDIGRLSVNNDWSGVLNINGFRGDDLTTVVGRDPQLVLTDSPDTQFNVSVNQTNPNTNTSGGIAEFQLANPTIALQGSGTADAPNLVLYLDSTGRENVVLTFNARDIDGSADNAAQQIAVQYRTSPTGAWINLPSGFVADATSGPSLATQVTAVTVNLPADAANVATLEVRIITVNATGNDEWVGIDDIVVTSSEQSAISPGALSVNDVTVVEGNEDTLTDIVFTITRAGGSDGVVSATWTLGFPDSATGADQGDFAFGTPTTGTVTFADGQVSATITISVRGDLDIEPTETFTLDLSDPVGGVTLADASGTGTITNDELPPIANVFINEIHYDNAGADVNETIEIAGLAGTDLTGWSLALYNGNDGAVYSTLQLSGTIVNQSTSFGTRSFSAPGIQNGPDAIALVDPYGRVVQFLSYEGVFVATSGPANGLSSTDIGVSEASGPAAGLSLQLVGTGSTAADFTWVAAADDSFGAVNTGQTFLSGTDQGQIRVNDVSIVEGNDSNETTTVVTITIYRAGGFDSVATVDYALNFSGSADSSDLGSDIVTEGTLTFGVGVTQVTLQYIIDGDAVGEDNETFSINLSNVTGNAVITDSTATITILNDDPVTLTIAEIQGAGHRSDYVGQPVTTTGIVTAVDTNGFYLQSISADNSIATSDGIFIFTSTLPTVVAGDAVTVSGTVNEFVGGAGALSVTQIVSPTLTFLSAGNALPEAVIIGAGGRTPPTGWIDNDGLTSFDPETDGIDFWESLEGMRVTIDAPIVVSNTTSFGETDVVASGGVGATGINDRGGITVAPGDFSPEKIQIDDDSTIFSGFTPGYSIGDRLSSVTGIVNYSFNNYEVLVTQAVTVTTDVTLAREVTSLVGDLNHVTIATYNVENLDPTDTKFDLLAADIVYSLRAPDIIGLQEIQDADGAGTGTNLSGTVTAQLLIDAIVAAGGPRYTYIESAPTTANTTGGEPNGNIRPGFLYNADRVSYVEGSLTQVTGPAFNNSRSPLVASFSFNGQVITAVNVHFTSRGGSDTLWGANQPPAAAGEGSRTAQAAAVQAFVNNHLATNPDHELVVLGDFNGFYFEPAQLQLTGETGVLTNLATLLLPPEERYSYVFEGNAQLIDNILVTDGLIDRTQIDGVHINAQFGAAGRATDHDPQVARIFVSSGSFFGTALTDTLTGTPNVDNLYGLDGNDILFGLGSADYLSAGAGNDELHGDGGDDILIGGLGNDIYYVEGSDLIVEYLDGGNDIVIASANFVLTTGASVEIINALTGTTAINLTGNQLNHQLNGNDGVNILISGEGNDSLFGNRGADDLYGLAGEDFLDGGDAADYLSGGANDDYLVGGEGADILLGGDGDDNYVADGDDLLIEYVGGGEDSVRVTTSFVLVAGSEVEFIYADETDNLAIDIFGNEFANDITGNAGVNRLGGGLGADTLTGGLGQDYFDFSAALGNGNVDAVTDFSSDDDLFLIDSRIFTGMTTGFLDASAFLSGAGVTAATSAAHRIIHDTTTGKLYFDADGDGAGAAVEFATIAPGAVAINFDFYVY
jgi:uncharacterized protein